MVNGNLLLKNKRLFYNLTRIFLILTECTAVVLCCAVITVFSQENVLDRLVNNTGDLFISNINSGTMETAAVNAVEEYEEYLESIRWKGPVLSRSKGTVIGPSGKETYYNLNMDGVVSIMRRMGNNDEYWVREDGCKMLGDYIMVAANLNLRPRGSIVETSLGKAIVCDTGTFARRNPTQIDVAVTW